MTQLPSPIGPLQATANGLTLHGADERRFDPIAHWSRPDQEPPVEPTKRPLLEAPQTPIALIPDTKFIPLHYVVHMASQRCLYCSTVHESSAVYAYNSIMPRLGIGKRISHLVPVERFSYNVPVKVQRLKETTVPACHECAREGLSLSHLPRPIDTAEYQKIVATYHRPPAEKATKGGGATSHPKAKSIDSLFEGL